MKPMLVAESSGPVLIFCGNDDGSRFSVLRVGKLTDALMKHKQRSTRDNTARKKLVMKSFTNNNSRGL